MDGDNGYIFNIANFIIILYFQNEFFFMNKSVYSIVVSHVTFSGIRGVS